MSWISFFICCQGAQNLAYTKFFPDIVLLITLIASQVRHANLSFLTSHTLREQAYQLKLKMKCCDWIKQIKHIYIYLVMDMCDKGKNKMNMSPKVEQMKEYLEFIRSFSCKKIKQQLKVYLKAALWWNSYSKILLQLFHLRTHISCQVSINMEMSK